MRPDRSPGRLFLFDPVLGLGIGNGLPLHVASVVQAAALERHNVIDYIPRARPCGLSRRWTWVGALKGAARGGTSVCDGRRSTLRGSLVASFAACGGAVLGVPSQGAESGKDKDPDHVILIGCRPKKLYLLFEKGHAGLGSLYFVTRHGHFARRTD